MINQPPSFYSPPTKEKKEIPWVTILASVLGVILVVFVILFFVKRSSFNKELNQNQKEIQELKNEVQRLKDLRGTI